MCRYPEFEWDDAKALSNFVKHRIEFSYATTVFLDPKRMDLDVSRPADGEMRRKVIGVVEDRLLTVVYTIRSRSIRIISARRSNTTENKMYGPLYP
jgi:uncharacterized DUF497 family protein